MLESVDEKVKVEVMRNDDPELDKWKNFDKVVLSPGPGLPQQAGLLMSFIQNAEGRIPILGVCLGQQALAMHYGGKLKNLRQVLHGQSIPANIVDPTEPLFCGVPSTFMTGRYHSWVVDRESLPSELRITALDDSGEIMALRHREFDIAAVQFHPESVLTPLGAQILANWIKS